MSYWVHRASGDLVLHALRTTLRLVTKDVLEVRLGKVRLVLVMPQNAHFLVTYGGLGGEAPLSGRFRGGAAPLVRFNFLSDFLSFSIANMSNKPLFWMVGKKKTLKNEGVSLLKNYQSYWC